jgi:ADP-ribose pyrophosphatase
VDSRADEPSREYPQAPTAAASAVVIRDRQILLVKRAHEPGKGQWSIPGGRIEVGETIHDAVRREVMEECGIEIEVVRILGAFDRIIRDADGRVRFHYVLIDVLAAAAGGEPRAGSDADECRWATREEMESLHITPQLHALLVQVFEGVG